MKILMLAPQPFFEERGTPIAVRLAAEALAGQGHEVDLLTFHVGQDVAMPGVSHHRIAAPPGIRRVPIGFSPAKLVCDLWMFFAAARLLLRQRYDVVHAVEEAVFLAWPLATMRRAHLVYDADSILSEQVADKWPKARLPARLLAFLERAAFRRSDLTLAVCPAIQTAARGVAAADRVHLLPDVAFEDPGSAGATEDIGALANGRPLALYVGNLEAYQGVALLIEALALVDPNRRPMLVIIGGNPQAIADHAALADRLGIAADVRLLGARPLGHLAHYLAQADILCSPRIQGRNTPMKIFSYMASTRPILATRIESHSQVLDDGSAWLAPPTALGLAEGMERLAHDAALRGDLGRVAAHRARTEFSHGAFVERLRLAYATLQPRIPPAPRPLVKQPVEGR
ncbi:glycosyltransferase family 4 protein [Sphingobium scionense]|uniref:Glycosyltransferase involved in cell wall biosynthesis n=1 Tax=Sphingobium scionense TaxID=1404341 RepID=A0A7W6LQG1_9SPHN|nr:glycosyltransferase family 4 protein [Sphingobium scionense]MBB4148322.1 glycosyltransferase involved in cell wall biosynthesis [Sphingobium scionense]